MEVPSDAGSLPPPHSDSVMVHYSRAHVDSSLIQGLYETKTLAIYNTVNLHLHAASLDSVSQVHDSTSLITPFLDPSSFSCIACPFGHLSQLFDVYLEV